MALRPTTALLLLATVVVTLLVLACSVHAIHEDEQGLRDWVMRFSGNVRHAAVPPVADPSMIYVLSEEGAVTALDVTSRGALNLTWREVFSDAPQCLAAASAAVLAVDAKGAAYLLNPEHGFIETTFLLQRPSAASTVAKAVACSVVKDTATIAMYDNVTGAIRVYSFDITAEDEVIAPKSTISAGSDVIYMRLGGDKHLWATQKNQRSVQYDITSGSRVGEGEGSIAFVGPEGEHLLVTGSGIKGTGAEGKVFDTDCTRCSGTEIVQPDTGAVAASSIVTVTTEGSVMRVAFPKDVVEHEVNHSASIAYPLLAFTRESEEDVVYVLVKTASQHLMLLKSDGTMVWERREGLSGVAATLIVAPPNQQLDRFHFNKQVLLATRFGTLYSVPLTDMGTKIEVITDFTAPLLEKLQATSMKDVSVRAISQASPTTVVIRCKHGGTTAVVFVDIVSRSVTEVRTFEEALVVAAKYTIDKDLTLHGSLDYSQLFVYVANSEDGVVDGYSVSNATKKATPAWSVRLPYPIVAHTSGKDLGRTAIVNMLRVYPNNTGAEPVEEVRHRYPTHNVVVVAYYEPATEDHLSTLVITALDAVTGSVLATTRHEDVEGDVKMVIVEHAVIYYFLDASKMRYVFGVWEMFEEEQGDIVHKSDGATLPQVIASFFVKTDRVFSSRASRPPVVAAATLGVHGGPIVDMGVTTSNGAIARKSVVLAFQTGRVAILEVRHLLAGGQMPMPNVENKRISHVILPSSLLATHKYRLAQPRHVTTEPTNLESSCHVVVTGLDLFYVRSSSGKPFDLLNSDFNKPLLVALVAGFAVVSLLVRYLVMRKSLNSQWE